MNVFCNEIQRRSSFCHLAIHFKAKVSEEVKRKCPTRNTTLTAPLLALYTPALGATIHSVTDKKR